MRGQIQGPRSLPSRFVFPLRLRSLARSLSFFRRSSLLCRTHHRHSSSPSLHLFSTSLLSIAVAVSVQLRKVRGPVAWNLLMFLCLLKVFFEGSLKPSVAEVAWVRTSCSSRTSRGALCRFAEASIVSGKVRLLVVFGLLSCEVRVARVCCKPLWTLSKYIVVTLGRMRRDHKISAVAVIVCNSGIVCASWYVCGVVGLHCRFQAASRPFAHGYFGLEAIVAFFGWLKTSASISVGGYCVSVEHVDGVHEGRVDAARTNIPWIALGLSFWSFRGLCRKPRESSHVKLVVVGAAVRFVGLLQYHGFAVHNLLHTV